MKRLVHIWFLITCGGGFPAATCTPPGNRGGKLLSSQYRLRHKRAGQPPIPNEPESPPPAPERQADALSAYLLDTISRFELFAPRMLRIQTKAGDLVDFEMNEVQDLMEMVLQTIRNQKRRVRVVILKARRKGISTWVSGRFFWKTTTNRNRYSMIVTHEPEATDFVFKMHKRVQDNLPEWFRPTERYNNKKMLEFNNDAGTGLDSAIRVGTAAKEDFGSSQLIHYLQLSEVPKWPRHVTTNLILSSVIPRMMPQQQPQQLQM